MAIHIWFKVRYILNSWKMLFQPEIILLKLFSILSEYAMPASRPKATGVDVFWNIGRKNDVRSPKRWSPILQQILVFFCQLQNMVYVKTRKWSTLPKNWIPPFCGKSGILFLTSKFSVCEDANWYTLPRKKWDWFWFRALLKKIAIFAHSLWNFARRVFDPLTGKSLRACTFAGQWSAKTYNSFF